jgi:hypothetical protein
VPSLKGILEWFGGLAVIASLLLVAFEIRQNTNAVSAQALYDLNETGREMLLMLATDAELARLFRLGDSNPDALDSDEWYRYQYYVWANLNMYESVWSYHRSGIIGDDYFEPWMVDYCLAVSEAGFKRVMANIAAVHSSEFRKEADSWCQSNR